MRCSLMARPVFDALWTMREWLFSKRKCKRGTAAAEADIVSRLNRVFYFEFTITKILAASRYGSYYLCKALLMVLENEQHRKK